MHRTWKDVPSNQIEGNFHPYPTHELQRARSTLILGVNNLISSSLRLQLGLKRRQPPGEPGSGDEGPSKAPRRETPPSNKPVIPNWKSYGANVKDNTILKCDLCPFKVDTESESSDASDPRSEMHNHLYQEMHYSASKYCRNGLSVLVGPMLKCKNNKNFTQMSVLPVCPICSQVFPDIFMCSMHAKYIHKSGINGNYALMKVIERKVIPFSDTTCPSCKHTFSTASQLHQHWISSPGHHPLQRPQQSTEISVYVCMQCEQFFPAFNTCRMHIINHRRHRYARYSAPNKEIRCVEVIFIQRPTKSDTRGLPMLKGSQPTREKEILHRLVRYYNSTCVMKNAKERINEVLDRKKGRK